MRGKGAGKSAGTWALKAGNWAGMLGVVLLELAGVWALTHPSRPTVVLAINSGACGCAHARCASLENGLKEILVAGGFEDKVALQIVDINPNQPGKKVRTWGGRKAELLGGYSHPVLKKYGMELVPALVVVDGRDEVRYRASYLDQEQIKASLQVILAEN